MFLADTSVLIEVAKADGPFYAGSAQALARAIDRGPVFVNPVIYAELSVGYDTVEQVARALADLQVARAELPYEAAFLAGKAFQIYKRRGGAKTAPLPDFFIGAHAAVRRWTLITRDPRRVRDLFPSVGMITPDYPASA